MSIIVLATRNKGKVAELRALLEGFGVEVQSLDQHPEVPEVEETGSTFEENARIKAEAVCRATGLVALADDSGIVVDALGGAPGVHSARYSGPGATDAANNIKLLKELNCVPEERRTARFVSVVAACAPGGAQLTARGVWEGRVLKAPRGQGGFGYDPLFLDPAHGKTAAEMTAEEKNAASHRGKALRALKELWPDFWEKAVVP